jgi:hypothetical protein
MTMSSVPESTGRVESADPKPSLAGPEPHVAGTDDASSALVPLRLWILVLAAAVIAGMLAWTVGEKTYGLYRPSKEAYANRYNFAEINRQQAVADRKNGAIAFGTFGALLGLFCGAAGGLSRRPTRALSLSALAGLVLGGLFSSVAGYVLAPMLPRFYNDADPTILLPLLVRGGIVAAVGLTAGLAFGLGRAGPRGILRPLAGGLVGGVLGIAAFEIIYALGFPTVRNDNAIPLSAMTRLLCYLCAAIGVAIGILIVGQDRARPVPAIQAPPTVAS